jgi:hypothetical protein
MTTVLRYETEELDGLPKFIQWERGQVIPVRITGFSSTEQQWIIDYCIAKINSLPLDIKLAYTAEPKLPGGGISITFDNNISYISTRAVYSTTSEDLGSQRILVQSIRVSKPRMEAYKGPQRLDTNPNYPIAMKNAILHEILHALGFQEHIANYIKPAQNGKPFKVILDTLMSSSLGSAYLEWTYSDEIRLLWMYATKPSTRSKTLKFKPEDVGKWCFLVNQTNVNMSIVLKIESTEMTFDYFRKGPYKQVIQAVEVRND